MRARAICLLASSFPGCCNSRLHCVDFYSCRLPLLLLPCVARPSRTFLRTLQENRRKELFRRVFRSRLQARETNSPRPGSNLWSPRSSPAPTGRRPYRRPRHGRHSTRPRHPLAPCPRRQRENPDSRTSRVSAKKTPRIRRHSSRRIPHQHKKTSLDSAAKERPGHEEKPSPVGKIQMKI